MSTFTCALAAEFTGIATVRLPAAVEPKLDGIRCLAETGAGGVVFRTRTGRELVCLARGRIARELERIEVGRMLDGELVAGTFAETLSALKTNPDRLCYHVFDIVPARVFHECRDGRRIAATADLAARRLTLESAARTFAGCIRLVPQVVVSDWGRIEAAYRRYRADGYEGAVVKDVESPYHWGRRTAWTKLKPELTVEGRITGLVEGSGRYAGGVGALAVEVAGVVTGVGTGFLDAERREMWERRAVLIGTWCEFTAQERLPSGVYRFPAFVRLRPDIQ